VARCTLLFALVAGLVFLPGAAAGSGKTTRASVGPGGLESDGYSDWPALSDDGKVVAFYSFATNLVPGDTNEVSDIFVHDRGAAVTRRVSVSSAGEQANGRSWGQQVDAAGNLVAFASEASNLVAGDVNGQADVFIHDLRSGETELVSVASSGERGFGYSHQPDLDPDGRLIAWSSTAANLVADDTNEVADIFVRDLVAGTTRRVSVSTTGMDGNGQSERPALSADGRVVAFESGASNLVPGDLNGVRDVYVHDIAGGTTTRVSSGGGRDNHWPAISADGRYIAFIGNSYDILAHDRRSGTTEHIDVNNQGVQANSESNAPSISADGRFVAFDSWATNLSVGSDTNESYDVFVRDRVAGLTARVSVDDLGREANENSHGAAISADGRFVAFSSIASNLADGDANGTYDVYVHGPVGFAANPPPRPRKRCRVPAVVGLRVAAAKARIHHAHCALGRVRRVATDEANASRVLRQRPHPGTRLPHRGRVHLVVGWSP
jgi:Tol biopolymer transport system component